MLPFHGRWRNASKRAPEREARLLMYGSNNPPPAAPSPGDDDNNKKKSRGNAINDFFVQQEKERQERERLANAGKWPEDKKIDAMSAAEFADWKLKMEKEEFKQKVHNIMEGNSPYAKDAASKVAEGSAETKSKINDALGVTAQDQPAPETGSTTGEENNEDSSVEQERVNVTLQETQAVTREMTEVISGMLQKLQSSNASAEEYLEESDFKEWKRLQEELARTLGDTQKDRDLLEVFAGLEGNEESKMPPNGVIAFARRKIKRRIEEAQRKNESSDHYESMMKLLEEADAIIQGKRPHLFAKDVSMSADWEKLSTEEKARMYELLRDTLHFDDALNTMEARHRAILEMHQADSLKTTEDLAKGVQDRKTEVFKDKSLNATAGGSSGFGPMDILKKIANLPEYAGIEFYSPMQIWEAFKQVGETLQDISKKKNALKIASFAEKIGNIVGIIPKYKNAKEILRRAHEEENEKIRKGYKEALGAANWQPGFEGMFGPGQLMDKHFEDKNMTMAILEYAASKGMVYKMKEGNWQTDKLLGRWYIKDLVPASWSDAQIASYYGNVDFDNEQGEKKQQKIGYDNNKTFAKIDQFMGSLNGALNDKDFWYARGVVERAMEKVDTGNMASIIAVTVMRHIEKNPDLGRIIPMKWLDQVGGEGKELNMGLLKFEQAEIVTWAKQDSRDIREVPRLGNFIADVREYLMEKDPSLRATDDKTVADLDMKTSQLMSSFTVTLSNKKTATIYDSRFDQYVGEVLKEPNWARGVPMDKSWDDFFVNPSEFQRGSQTLYDAIFEVDTNGKFRHEPRVRYFLSNLEKTHQSLLEGIRKAATPEERAELKAAEQNFCYQVRTKMDNTMTSILGGREIGTTLANRYFLAYNNAPVFVSFIEQGMLSLDVFEDAIQRNSSSMAFATAIVDQCLNRKTVSDALRDSKLFQPEDKNEKPQRAAQRQEEKERALIIEEEAKALKAMIAAKQGGGAAQNTNQKKKRKGNGGGNATGAAPAAPAGI